MRGAYFQYQKLHGVIGSEKTAAVEQVAKEDAELRRARIMNKAEGQNGPWPDNVIQGDQKN
jgi:hypothetical protein